MWGSKEAICGSDSFGRGAASDGALPQSFLVQSTSDPFRPPTTRSFISEWLLNPSTSNAARDHAPDATRGSQTPDCARAALIVALCALATGCFGGLSGGPASSLTREAAPIAVDLRLGLAAGDNHGPGATAGGHVRTKFSNDYNEIALGLDGSVLGIYEFVALEARFGASLAPFVLRRDTLGFSPAGAFAQTTLFVCTGQCFRDEAGTTQAMVALSVAVDARLLLLGRSLDLRQEAFLMPMVGLTFFEPLKIW